MPDAANQTSDILTRLRAPMWRVEPVDIRAAARDAADEIERLRAELAELKAQERDRAYERHGRDR